jgi:hypothetical protein
MQAARFLSTIKQNKDAAGARLMELDAHDCANLRPFARITHFAERTKSNSVTNPEWMHYFVCRYQVLPFFWRASGGHVWTFTILIRSISTWTVARLATPGKTMSGSATCESVGQNSGLFVHCVPDSSGHASLRISQSVPFDLTIVVHFGHRVCIFQICYRGRPFSSSEVRENQTYPLPRSQHSPAALLAS